MLGFQSTCFPSCGGSRYRYCCSGPGLAVYALIENGAVVDFETSKNRTALMMAAINGNMEMVKKLVELGANVNYVNRDRWVRGREVSLEPNSHQLRA